jgi:hypothetical protein
LLYTGIGVVILVTLTIFARYEAKTGGSPNLPLKWLGFGGLTAIVFGYAVRACRQFWKRQSFWWLLGGFCAAHFALGVCVLLKVQTVPMVLYALLTALEYAVLTAYLDYFLAPD